MAGQLITLPVRVGMRAAQLYVRFGLNVAVRAYELAGDVLGRDGHEDFSPSPPREAARPRDVEPSREAEPARVQPQPPVRPVAPAQPAASEPEAPHVSEEPVLVEELAEPGAEDGAGANITVAEPWEGYDKLAAKEVVRRAREASAAELAAIELYESSNRNRETVLSAVKRELRSKNGST